jgi:hypothetical protein
MIARMGPAEREAVLSQRHKVREALKLLPLDATLADPSEQVPWSALNGLFGALDNLPGIRLARATKILHKKRPALIPILDGVVVGYL